MGDDSIAANGRVDRSVRAPAPTKGEEMSTEKCTVCARGPERMNNEFAECSHCDCPHRRRAWSDRPTSASMFRGPWPKNTDSDPTPLDFEGKS